MLSLIILYGLIRKIPTRSSFRPRLQLLNGNCHYLCRVHRKVGENREKLMAKGQGHPFANGTQKATWNATLVNDTYRICEQ